MLNRLVALFLLLTGCATTAIGNVRTLPSEQEPSPTSINLSRYAPPALPDLVTPINLQTVVSSPPPGAAIALMRRGVRYEAPDDGLYMTSAAEAAIEASVFERLRTSRNECRTTVAETNASALRDLQIMQSDTNILRAFYMARLRDRDIALDGANQTITTLQHASTNNIWQNMGWAALGVVIGAGVAGIVILSTR